jgi:hypothetical protein
MNRQAPPPPPPPGWNKTIDDLFDESKKSGSAVGSPEVEWARDYERGLIPAVTRFPKRGDVYEATGDVEVSYLTSWSAPFTGGGSGRLKKGERVIIDYEPLPRPIAANAKAINYTQVEQEMVPESDRSNKKYSAFYLVLKTLQLSRAFKLVHEEPTADSNFKRPSGPRLPTTLLRVTSLLLRPSLGAAWLAWKIWPPVGFGAEPLAVAGPPSQRAAPPAWRPRRPSLQLRTSGPLPARSPVNEIGAHP